MAEGGGAGAGEKGLKSQTSTQHSFDVITKNEFLSNLGVWEGRGAKELWQQPRGYSAVVVEETPEMINSIF